MTSFSTNDTAFGLSAGSYYLEVMDANGCDTFTTVNVIGPQTPLTASPELFNVSCKGDATGMIVGDASGSWAPYTYYWLDMQGDTLQQSAIGISTRDTLIDLLVKEGILTKPSNPLKILGNGKLEVKLTVQAAAFTTSAKNKIEEIGGKCEIYT